jgi:hypothetical protein
MRNVNQTLARAMRFEFEDFVRGVDRVDVTGPMPGADYSPRLRALMGRADRVVPIGKWLHRSEKRYPLVFAGFQSVKDVFLLQPCSAWLSRGEVKACVLEELYVSRFWHSRRAIEQLKRFDLIFVYCRGTVERLRETTGRDCRFLAASVDALAACPYPECPPRVIDFFAMGRRPPATHAALLKSSQRRGWFYHYDTVASARFADFAEHRRHLADLIKRSRYFLANPARSDEREFCGDQYEIAFRHFEGTAGGAVMIGQPPRTEAFSELFDWPDVLISLPYDSGDVDEVLDMLEADPERVERARRRNVVNSLRRHDHVYRWAEVLAAAGLPETEAMVRRRQTLERLASHVERGIAAAVPT